MSAQLPTYLQSSASQCTACRSQALLLTHPRQLIRDTAMYLPFQACKVDPARRKLDAVSGGYVPAVRAAAQEQGLKSPRPRKLRALASELLGLHIQVCIDRLSLRTVRLVLLLRPSARAK